MIDGRGYYILIHKTILLEWFGNSKDWGKIFFIEIENGEVTARGRGIAVNFSTEHPDFNEISNCFNKLSEDELSIYDIIT